ncbi:MAG: ABC transporter substrate-binding protein [Chloroflexota bacterium]|nr:MAG: ABC transporter substrate-binding protein [Chloroflexota bacterium]
MSFARSRMPRMIGSLLAVILVGILVAGCGGSQSAPQSSQSSASTKASESSKPAESAKPSASASAPAANKDPLKVGMILTLTGPQGSIGTKQQLGLQMALEEINAAGGIMGRKVELIERDDGGDPTKARTAAQELVEKNGVTLIIGTTISSPALAIMPYLTEQKVFLLGSHSADATNDPQKYPYAFTGSPLASLQAAVVAKYPIDVLKTKKIAILAESSAYGNSMVPAYKQVLTDAGVQPVAVEQYPQGATDMTTQLTNLRKAGAEAILGGTLAADSVRIIKNLQSMGWEVPYLGNSDLATTAVVEGAGLEAMKKVYSYNQTQLSFSDKVQIPAKTKEFAAKLSKKLNQSPLKESILQPSLYYDLGYMLKWAVEKAQSTEGPKVAAVLETLKDFQGAHATFTFTKDNHCGLDLSDMVMVKAASMKDGVFELAPGY